MIIGEVPGYLVFNGANDGEPVFYTDRSAAIRQTIERAKECPGSTTYLCMTSVIGTAFISTEPVVTGACDLPTAPFPIHDEQG